MGLLDFMKKKDVQKSSKELFDMNGVSKWIDSIFEENISDEVTAFCFNLYDDGDNKWSMELVGTRYFNVDNTDWVCDEITDFGTRTKPFTWNRSTQWDKVLEETILVIKEYLENGKYANVLKSRSGVGAGFVDGDVEILHTK